MTLPMAPAWAPRFRMTWPRAVVRSCTWVMAATVRSTASAPAWAREVAALAWEAAVSALSATWATEAFISSMAEAASEEARRCSSAPPVAWAAALCRAVALAEMAEMAPPRVLAAESRPWQREASARSRARAAWARASPARRASASARLRSVSKLWRSCWACAKMAFSSAAHFSIV